MKKTLMLCAKRFIAILIAEIIAIGLMGGLVTVDAAEITGALESLAASVKTSVASSQTSVASSQTSAASSQTSVAAVTTSSPASSTSGMYTTQGDVINGLYYFPMGKDTLSEFHYKDSYFYEDSTIYNKSLATMSLAFEIAAGEACANNSYTTGYVDAQDLLDKLGFVNFEANEAYTIKPTLYTIGACIAEKEITLADGSKTTLIALAVRGAGYDAEWGSNVLLGEDGEAEGFSTARYQVVEFFNDYLEKYKNETHTNPKIWIVGYSRASAVADLFANYLNCAVLNDDYSDNASTYYGVSDMFNKTSSLVDELDIKFNDIFTYGFEVPAAAVDNSETIASDNSNIWCHVDPADVVPYVAPSNYGFYRYGNEVNMANVEDDALGYQLKAVSTGMYKDWFEPLTAEFELQSLSITNLIKNALYQRAAEYIDIFVEYPSDPLVARISKYTSSLTQVTEDSKTGCENIGNVLYGIMSGFSSAIGSREEYSKYLEQGLSALLTGYMAADSSGKQKIADTLCDTAIDAAKSKAGTLIKHVSEYLLPHWSWRSDGKDFTIVQLTDDAKEIVTKAINKLCSDNSTRKYFGTSAAAIENPEFINKLVTSVVEFAFWDYEENDGELLGTAIYYAQYIIGPHLLENLYAYARANDSSFDVIYPGMQVLTLSADSGLATDGLDIQVYWKSDNSDDEELLATIVDDEIYYANEYHVGYVSLSRKSDGSRIIYAYNPMYSDYHVQVRIKTSGEDEKDIYLDYLNWACANNYKDTNENWENTKIPMTEGDEIVMDLYELGDDEESVFNKYITLNASITDENFKAINGITVKLAGKDGARFSLDEPLQVYNAGNFEFDCTNTDNYKFLDMCELVLDENGKTQKDKNGNILHNTLSTGTNPIRYKPDITSTSKDVVLRFYDTSKAYKVSAIGVAIAKGYDDYEYNTGSITIKNETTGKIVDAYGERLDALPGDIITVSLDLSTVADGYRFVEWGFAGVEANEQPVLTESVDGGTFSFTMPARNTSIKATFITTADAPHTITFKGYLYDPVNGESLTDKNIKLLYSDDSSSQYSTKVYKVLDSSKQAWLLIKAPEYLLEEAGDIVFDHWCVTHSDTGNPWGADNNYDYSTVTNATAFTMINYKGKQVYSMSGCYNPNGSTYEWIMINNVNYGSMTLMPVYKTAEYTYNVVLSDGSTVTGTAKMGDTVTITDSEVPAGKTFECWTGTAAVVTDEIDSENGYVHRKVNDPTEIEFEDAENKTLTFTMPRGDVEIQAVDADVEYSVDITGGLLNDQENAFTCGTRVTFTAVNVPLGKIISGWKGNAEVTQNGSEYSFIMPAENVKLEAVYEDIPTHKLTLTDATASYESADGNLVEDVTSCSLYEGAYAVLYPVDKAGLSFIKWEITEGSATLEDGGDFAIIEMGTTDVEVKAVFVESQIVSSVELTTDTLPKTNIACLLPDEASCESTGVSTDEIEINWSRSSGGSVDEIVNWGETCSAVITGVEAERGYKFDATETQVTVNGEAATFTINDDGSLNVNYSFTMECATISQFQSQQYAVSGLANGTDFDTIDTYLLGMRHYVTMEITAQGIKKTINGTCVWDIDELENRSAGDANGTYDPTLKTAQTFTVMGYVQWDEDDWELPWSEGATIYNDKPLGADNKMPVSVKVTVLAEGSLLLPVITADSDKPGNYDKDVSIKLEYPGTVKSGSVGIVYMICSSDIGTDPSDASSNWEIEEFAAYEGNPIVISGADGEVKNYAIYVASMAIDDVELDDGTIISKGTFTSEITYFIYTIDKSEPVYNIEVKELSLSLDNPVAGYTLDRTADVISATTNMIDQIVDGQIAVSYIDADGNPAQEATYDTTYKAVFYLTTENYKGVKFTENTKVFVNGRVAYVTLNDETFIDVEVEFPKTDSKPLPEVTNVSMTLSGALTDYAEFPTVVNGSNEGVAWEKTTFKWLDESGSEATGTAQPNKDYTLCVTIYPSEGYALSPSAYVTVDGNEMKAELADDGSIVATYVLSTDFARVEFVDGIIYSDTEVKNGTPLSEEKQSSGGLLQLFTSLFAAPKTTTASTPSLTTSVKEISYISELLPSTTKVIISGKEMQVDIDWDLDSAEYDTAVKDKAQVVKINGKLHFDKEKNIDPADVRYSAGTSENVVFMVTVLKKDSDKEEETTESGTSESEKEVPNTGDTTNIWLYIIIAAAALVLIAIVLIFAVLHRKKDKESK